MVETAISFVPLLGLFFAGFQIGMVAYYQLAMDVGNQMQARSTALGFSPENSNTVVLNSVPNLRMGKVHFPDPKQNSESDTPGSISTNQVDFNFMQPQARTGGFTFDAPLPYVSTTTQNNGFLKLGTMTLAVESTAVEAQVKELCPHYCLVPGGLPNATSADTLDYFTKGDNTPPYFIGFDYMVTCGSDPFYDLTQRAANLPAGDWNWNGCPPGDIAWRALGTAAHLDETNNNYTLPSEELDGSYRGLPHLPPRANQAGPFFELWCHRNMYAWIERQWGFPAAPAPAPLPNSSTGIHAFLSSWLNDGNSVNPGPGALIYNVAGGRGSWPADQTAGGGWDSIQAQGSGVSAVHFNAALSPWWGCGLLPGG